MGQPHGTPGILKPPGGMCWRFEDCRLNEIEWAPLMSNGAFPDPIHTLKGCSLKYETKRKKNQPNMFGWFFWLGMRESNSHK